MINKFLCVGLSDLPNYLDDDRFTTQVGSLIERIDATTVGTRHSAAVKCLYHWCHPGFGGVLRKFADSKERNRTFNRRRSLVDLIFEFSSELIV